MHNSNTDTKKVNYHDTSEKDNTTVTIVKSTLIRICIKYGLTDKWYFRRKHIRDLYFTVWKSIMYGYKRKNNCKVQQNSTRQQLSAFRGKKTLKNPKNVIGKLLWLSKSVTQERNHMKQLRIDLYFSLLHEFKVEVFTVPLRRFNSQKSKVGLGRVWLAKQSMFLTKLLIGYFLC